MHTFFRYHWDIGCVKKRILTCPQCGSSDLYYEAGLITGYKYHCKRCQYVGSFVIEKEIEI